MLGSAAAAVAGAAQHARQQRGVSTLDLCRPTATPNSPTCRCLLFYVERERSKGLAGVVLPTSPAQATPAGAQPEHTASMRDVSPLSACSPAEAQGSLHLPMHNLRARSVCACCGVTMRCVCCVTPPWRRQGSMPAALTPPARRAQPALPSGQPTFCLELASSALLAFPVRHC